MNDRLTAAPVIVRVREPALAALDEMDALERDALNYRELCNLMRQNNGEIWHTRGQFYGSVAREWRGGNPAVFMATTPLDAMRQVARWMGDGEPADEEKQK